MNNRGREDLVYPPAATDSTRRHTRLRGRLRRTVERAVVLILAAIVFRTWCAQGFFQWLQVASGSMADTLVGPHREVQCTGCLFCFPCRAHGQTARSRVVCPHCGTINDLPSAIAPGDRVLLSKSVFRLRRPRRWEVIAFRHPHRAAMIVVKRVVGLPGEAIRVQRGEVFVGERLQRKSLKTQQAVAILVHDNEHRHPTLPPRWQNEHEGKGWVASGAKFFHPSSPDLSKTDWLTYRHWSPVHGSDRVREAPITNIHAYNQPRVGHPQSVHPVTDVGMSFQLAMADGEGQFLLRASDGRDEFVLQIDGRTHTYRVSRNGVPCGPEHKGAVLRWNRQSSVQVWLTDCRFLVALDGRPLVSIAYPWQDDPPPGTSRPVAIGARGLDLEIGQLKVFRDVDYHRPLGGLLDPYSDQTARLEPDEFYVLGDNPWVSDDSRTGWPGAGVASKLLVGKPFLVLVPGRRMTWGAGRFQVPDFAKIRYIR